MENKNAFDPNRYKQKWKKENMKRVNGYYKTEFVDEFKNACTKLGLTQSEVIRVAMKETIKKSKIMEGKIMIKYAVETGFINGDAHISNENTEYFDTKEQAQERFDEFKRTLEYGTSSEFPEYVTLDEVEFEDDEIVETNSIDYFEEER